MGEFQIISDRSYLQLRFINFFIIDSRGAIKPPKSTSSDISMLITSPVIFFISEVISVGSNPELPQLGKQIQNAVNK